MFSCRLCEKNSVITTNLCDKCRRIKHLINLYDERVYEVLENCLVRKEFAIKNKERQEVKHTVNTMKNSIADIKAESTK